MKNCTFLTTLLSGILILTTGGISTAQPDSKWKINDMRRPQPPMVTPGTASTQEKAGTAPSDAMVLFDGTNLNCWTRDGKPAEWKVENGYMEVVPGKGSIKTRQAFGDCQLHVEWSSPVSDHNSGQGKGNSGVYLMDTYEIQVLDSYQNTTYTDGQAASIYAQYPPMVNSCLPPGEWQTYDIIFKRPRFDADGKVLQPATITLLHNGVLVQDHAVLTGPTDWMRRPPYRHHPDKLPLSLQNHGDQVRYRNIWIRELEPIIEREKAIQLPEEKEISLSPDELKPYIGKYELSPNSYYLVKKEGNHLVFCMGDNPLTSVYPVSRTKFVSRQLDTRVEFSFKPDGTIEGLSFFAGSSEHQAKRRGTR